jgi:diguanylate cyclase (GGDEF)-like protein
MSSHNDDWDEATKAAPFLSGEELLSDQQQPEKAYLIVLSGNRLGSMIEVREGMVIGRAFGADLAIPEEGISRQHVKISANPQGELVAHDLGSLNGTYVNGNRIESAVLRDGDKIRIGTTTILKFSYADRLEESFQQQLQEAALRDPLTRLHNRRSLDDHLARELAFARRHGSALSLILIDIDHFKNVNDTHGHPVGDQLLRGLATTLVRQIRQEDLLARYGGEEFALLCRGINGAIAFVVADRLRTSVAGKALVESLPDLRVTFSAGVAAIPAMGIDNEQHLVEAADRALYRAKKEGRNRAVLHDITQPFVPAANAPRQTPAAAPAPEPDFPADEATPVPGPGKDPNGDK